MAHESFEDQEVAKLLNESFVAIKVDREERPDVDNIYMAVCIRVNGSGGWPLTIFMTPDKQPFFAGTYFPKSTMLALLPRVSHIWKTQRKQLLNDAAQIIASLEQAFTPTAAPDKTLTENAFRQLARQFDRKYGGFGRRPKFPSPHNLMFLLRYWRRTQNQEALAMVEQTLTSMRQGGLYDHVGFGFHRYSTDERWFLPHFEKMIYDQAMLTMAYIEAYQATGNPLFRQTAEEILAYCLRDMQSPAGGFYSAQDADSEGEEGKFYLWSAAQLRSLLSSADADLVIQMFQVEAAGNFYDEASSRKTGLNLLHLGKSWGEIARNLKLSEGDLSDRWAKIRDQLWKEREKRTHPHKDDKILSDWNGLMIAALSKASQAFGDARYHKAAQRAADFVLNTMRKNGRLFHRYRDGEVAIIAYLDDYAFMVAGLLELYEACFDVKYLKAAIELNEMAIKHFWDERQGGFYFTADDNEALLVRQKEIYDGAIPSGNSVAMHNLLRLARLTGKTELEARATQISKLFSSAVAQAPSGYCQFLCGVEFGLGPAYEIVIVGSLEEQDTQSLVRKLYRHFIPHKAVLLKPIGAQGDALSQIIPLIEHYRTMQGKATVYVCQSYTCQKPTTDAIEMIKQLGMEAKK
jgi:uncharacterized protein YyaL (SSP411 family)